MMVDKNKMDINDIIDFLLSQCNDLQTYSNIMQELFKNGIENKFSYIESLNILPKISDNQKMNNFKKNINKINTFLKTIIQSPTLDIFKVLSCIFGAFLGDAMGAFCEFEEPKDNSKNIFRASNTVIGFIMVLGLKQIHLIMVIPLNMLLKILISLKMLHIYKTLKILKLI